MSSLTGNELEGIWALSRVGEWDVLHGPSTDLDEGAMGRERVMELLAAMCTEHFPAVTTIDARVGGRALCVERSDEDTTVALSAVGGNPMLLRAAMRRARQANTAGHRSTFVSGAFAPQYTPSRRVSVSSPKDAARTSQRVIPSISLNTPIQAGTASALATDAVPDDAGQDHDFELVIDNLTTSSAIPQPAPAAALHSTSWQHVADYIQQALDLSLKNIGRRVAVNYWRSALQTQPTLIHFVTVDWSGQVCTTNPDTSPDDDLCSALQAAFEHWLKRCRRVMPHISEHLTTALGTTPWSSSPTGSP